MVIAFLSHTHETSLAVTAACWVPLVGLFAGVLKAAGWIE